MLISNYATQFEQPKRYRCQQFGANFRKHNCGCWWQYIVSVAEQLQSKAPKTTVYTKQETYTQQLVNALLSNMEDESLEAQLELKADIDDVNAALLLKRSVADSYTITQTNDLLAPKATTTYVDGTLNLKKRQIR